MRSNRRFYNKYKFNTLSSHWRLDLLHDNFKEFITKSVINITATPNNVFCTLGCFASKKVLFSTSAGKSKVKISKKLLKFGHKIIIKQFLDTIKKLTNSKHFIVIMSGPKRVRSSILKQLKEELKASQIIVNIKSKKCFNGCRPPKARRKKRNFFRIFK